MPVNIQGNDKGVRAVRRQIRALPLLNTVLEQTGVTVSAVPGTIRLPGKANVAFAGVAKEAGGSSDPMMFSRIDLSPSLCAAMDRGEPGMGVRASLSGAAALLLLNHIPAVLKQEAIDIVLADGKRMLAILERHANARTPGAQAILVQVNQTLHAIGDDRFAGVCGADAARPLFAECANGAPAPHIWPEYWLAAFRLAISDRARLARPEPGVPDPRLEAEAVRVCVMVHMPYEGEMFSEDPRWSLPRRLLGAAVDAARTHEASMSMAFDHVVEAIGSLPVSPRQAIRHALEAACHSQDRQTAIAARILSNGIYQFGSDCEGVEASKAAEPAIAALTERVGDRALALMTLRFACQYVVHVAAMTKTCFPADAARRTALMRLLAEQPKFGSMLAGMANVSRDGEGNRHRGDAATAEAALEARRACDFFASAMDFAREDAATGRADALRHVDSAVETMLSSGPARHKPIDLLHMMMKSHASSMLSKPAAWPDLAAGTVASVTGFGRTGDREAFMALADALRDGLHHRVTMEGQTSWTDEHIAAVTVVGHAFGRVSHALSTGTRQEDRFATMIQDLADIRAAASVLDPGFIKPVMDAVSAKLIFEFGTRDNVGCRTHTDERYVLPNETAVADACVAWVVADSADASTTDTARLLEAAQQIAQASRNARGLQAAENLAGWLEGNRLGLGRGC